MLLWWVGFQISEFVNISLKIFAIILLTIYWSITDCHWHLNFSKLSKIKTIKYYSFVKSADVTAETKFDELADSWDSTVSENSSILPSVKKHFERQIYLL